MVNPDEPASMNLLGAVNGKTLATSGYGGCLTLSASTCDTPEKIEAALTLLDKLNDNEMRLLTEYGIEGVNWETDENGYLVDLDVEDTTLAANYAGLNQMLAYLPRYTPEPAPELNERTRRRTMFTLRTKRLRYSILRLLIWQTLRPTPMWEQPLRISLPVREPSISAVRSMRPDCRLQRISGCHRADRRSSTR